MRTPCDLPRSVLLLGALVTAAGVLLQGLWLAEQYPAARLDADLLSYLTYYRDWRAGQAMPFGYTVPKVLPFLLFGAAGSPEAALVLSLAVAALGGALVFVTAAEVFGLATAVVAGLAYVFDPLRSVLTLRSSVDLYIGVALLGAVLALRRGAVLWAAVVILVAALGKPVAAACSLAILVAPHAPMRRRLLASVLPWLALPAAGVLHGALEGRSMLEGLLAFALPAQHTAFVQVAPGRPLGWSESLEMIFAEWFGGLLFSRTWPLVLLGSLLYLTGAARALRTKWERAETEGCRDPRLLVLLVPLLLTGAYIGLSMLHPFVLFTRFFWPLSVVLTMLAAFGVATIARHAPLPRVARVGAVAICALVLVADRQDDYRWRAGIMLDPFEARASIADRAVTILSVDTACAGPTIVPLAYLPLAAWRAPARLHRGELCATEDWAEGRGCADPRCVLFIPDAPTTASARDAVSRLVAEGWTVEVADDFGALVRSTPS